MSDWTQDIAELAEHEFRLTENVKVSDVPEMLDRYRVMLKGLVAERPFHKGDRVMLVREPIIGLASGWRKAAHFLIYGAEATVECVQMGPRGWRIGCVFDNDSWIDADGNTRTDGVVPGIPYRPSVYFMSVSQLERIEQTKRDIHEQRNVDCDF